MSFRYTVINSLIESENSKTINLYKVPDPLNSTNSIITYSETFID